MLGEVYRDASTSTTNDEGISKQLTPICLPPDIAHYFAVSMTRLVHHPTISVSSAFLHCPFLKH